MILRRISLTTKLAKLKELTKALKHLQTTIDKKKFLSSDIVQKAVERYLQLAIEAVLDISDHLITDYDLRKPEDYKETILILGENKILPQKFAEKFSHSAGFRNILVHDYIDLDLEKVYGHLKNDLGDFTRFLKHIAAYLS